ncbi:MAG: TIGR03435 family protein [Terriglobales bacterium]
MSRAPLAAVGLALALATCARTQAPPAFDAVSIKPTDMNGFHGPLCDDRGSDPAHYNALNCPLIYFISRAYGMPATRIAGAEPWMAHQLYTLAATAAGSPGRATQAQMLQALLADRFALQVHTATRAGKGFLLTAVRGAKLQPTANPANPPFVGLFRKGDTHAAATSYGLRGSNATIALLAQKLEPLVGGPLEDRTGLDGHYDFILNYTDRGQDLGLFPSLIPALQQQLGLKLDPIPVQISILVVDRAARPAAN